MSKHLDLVNEVQRHVIDFANSERFNLRKEFATVADFKKFVIAMTFNLLIDMGIETKDAYDMVFGDNAYNELASRVWHKARNKSEKPQDSAPCLATK